MEMRKIAIIQNNDKILQILTILIILMSSDHLQCSPRLSLMCTLGTLKYGGRKS